MADHLVEAAAVRLGCRPVGQAPPGHENQCAADVSDAQRVSEEPARLPIHPPAQGFTLTRSIASWACAMRVLGGGFRSDTSWVEPRVLDGLEAQSSALRLSAWSHAGPPTLGPQSHSISQSRGPEARPSQTESPPSTYSLGAATGEEQGPEEVPGDPARKEGPHLVARDSASLPDQPQQTRAHGHQPSPVGPGHGRWQCAGGTGMHLGTGPPGHLAELQTVAPDPEYLAHQVPSDSGCQSLLVWGPTGNHGFKTSDP
ncbi:hypothetical protein Celaphus_00003337 [Cervus elaphus hippelaphus]|uniref:Uncharacterized protein n=1 Tax=Cervus elaphus hippelaphus TaxID=46360 RepID=A0A212D0U9_CEREH|nr:hypothetical protein Celaphus_00003337 [Cervus elaphus hippelaphus]